MAANIPELSSSSSYVSNASSSNDASAATLETVSLSKLSSNLEQLLISDDFDCTDADVIIDGTPVGIHKCILAARSEFFKQLFRSRKGKDEGVKEGLKREKYYMDEMMKEKGRVGQEAFMVILGYLYTGRLKQSPVDVSTCVDGGCAHDSCHPAVAFVVEMMYASFVFQIPELVSLFQRRLLNFVEKALVEDVIPILLVALHSHLDLLIERCMQRVARSDLNNITLGKELPPEAVDNIKAIRKISQTYSNSPLLDMDPVQEKRIKRIHRALDSDDVELVKLLLSESNITLDDANALHYAAAYCDSKIVAEVLGLGMANVNSKNNRGYTPLHIAAIRREPSVIVSLLDKGARASEMTSDGQSAVSICRRLTRAKDYLAITMQGQESNKDRVCIDILEREIMRSTMIGDAFITSLMMSDNVHAKILYLENRVAFAKLFFPVEAKVAMEIAQAESTSEFAGLSISASTGNLRDVDLNETPGKRLLSRVDALMKTVELGRRYFPHCSGVLDKFLEDDHRDLFFLQKGTPDEQKMKKRRFCELRDNVLKAFSKDKDQGCRYGFLSSSSSPPQKSEHMKHNRASSK